MAGEKKQKEKRFCYIVYLKEKKWILSEICTYGMAGMAGMAYNTKYRSNQYDLNLMHDKIMVDRR